LGDDIRGKGVIWMIETMWDLEFKVYKNMLPEKIDERSKDFILEVYYYKLFITFENS
jgi:hypothetical protein